MGRMPRTGDQGEHGIGSGVHHGLGDGREAHVGRADHEEGRQLERRQALPQGRLRAGAGQAQARSQSRRRVSFALGDGCGVVRQAGEHRVREPAVDEGVDVTRALELLGQLVVPLAPDLPGRGIDDAGRAPDQHQPTDALRPGEGGVERDASAQRVAEEVEGPATARLGEQVARLDQIGAHVAAPPVSGEVHGAQLVVGAEQIAEGPPAAARLGEAVGEHERWALPGRLNVELLHGW